MAIKSILFNTDMVRAILDGKKTVTRRLIKPQPKEGHYTYVYCHGNCHIKTETGIIKPLYQPGDILYVRETWSPVFVVPRRYLYKVGCKEAENLPIKWHPSIHMPKEAARIWLKVKDVRVERLQEITEEQTEDEGFMFNPPCLSRVSENSFCDLDGPCTSKIKYCDMSAGELFGKVLWNSTINKSDLDRYGWDANPWVWVIEFERCEKPKVT